MKTAVRGTLAPNAPGGRKHNIRISAGTLALVSLLAGTALAQQKAAPAAEEPRSAVEQDIEGLFGKRRKVTVVQKRRYPKVGRWEVSAHFGVVANDPFMTYMPVGVRGTYHLKEWLGIEAGFMYMPGFESSLAEGIKNVGTGTGTTLQLTLLEKQKALFHLSATFSLLYGKVAVMQTALSYFDVFLTVGPSFHLVDPPVDSGGRETGASGFRVGGMFGAGMKFFLNDFFGIRLDVRQYLFPKSSDAGGGIHKPTEITLGATFFAG